MPYCSKCGSEVDDAVRFCPQCGGAVVPQAARLPPRAQREQRPITPLLLVIVAIAVILISVVFLPVRAVDLQESRHVGSLAGVDTINLQFQADVARITVAFADLDDQLVTLQLSVQGRTGVFAPSNLYDLTFNQTLVTNVLTVVSELDLVDLVWPASFVDLNVTCDLRIDRSLNTSLDVQTSVGEITMNVPSGVVLNTVSLETTTGGVEATLATGVFVSGDISIKSTTGGATLNWNQIVATKDVLVNVVTTTGGVDVDLTQDSRMSHNVTLTAETTTGGVDFTINIQGNVGAKIESSITTGGIDLHRQDGFSGTPTLLLSDNYPDHISLDVSLKATTGGIDIDARYAGVPNMV